MINIFGDTVLIRPDTVEEMTTQAGLVISAKAQKRPTSGVIVQKGPGLRHADGVTRPSPLLNRLSVGDRVIYNKFSQTDIHEDDEVLEILEAEDVLAIAPADLEIFQIHGAWRG